ncbi:MAG: VOC family protein [Anaerolineales bacterium]|nr:VOC family protein [Anaerolineales bacterium]
MSDKPKTGLIVWHDLTVANAEEIKNFYSEVVGWQAASHDMGDYHDFNISTPDGEDIIAGICHARGSNASLPPAWLIYVTVEDVAASAQRCLELGGKIIDGPRSMGETNFCVIQDPAGAVMALLS